MNKLVLAFMLIGTLGLIQPAAAQVDSPLDSYVAEGLRNNLALRQRSLDFEKSLQAMQEARGMFFPELNIQARYSRAGGGRQISFPVGDLLNPVYGTLNDLLAAQGQPAGFPTIDNVEIAFLRDREQETFMRVIQPVYQPAILHNYRLQRHLSSSREAALQAYQAVLTRDIKVAYYAYLQAERAVGILDAAGELVDENLRVNERLFTYQTVTRDAVYRARSEVLAVSQQQQEVARDRDLARSYFNFLLNRPLDEPIERVDEAAMIASVDPSTGFIAASLETREQMRKEALKEWALGNRYELKQLELAIKASESAVDISRSAFLPGVSLALDLGIQGEDYGFVGDRSFYMASLVLDWKIFSAGQERSRVQQARIESQRLQTQYDELQKQIELQVQESYDNLGVSLESLKTAEERLQTAGEGYRIVARQYDAGMSNQVTFLDARTTLTEAELNLNITRYDVLIRQAELEYASALTMTN